MLSQRDHTAMQQTRSRAVRFLQAQNIAAHGTYAVDKLGGRCSVLPRALPLDRHRNSLGEINPWCIVEQLLGTTEIGDIVGHLTDAFAFFDADIRIGNRK